MAIEIGSAYITILPSFKSFNKDLKRHMKGMGDLTPEGAKSGQKFGKGVMSGAASQMKKWGKRTLVGAAVAAGGLAATALTTGFQRSVKIENAKATLSGLGYNEKDIKGIMDQALGAVKGTAFGLDDAVTISSGALAAGVKDVEGYLKSVGDVATISGRSMTDIGGIFNKVMANNRLSGEEMSQLADSGIPVLKLLQDEYGVTADEARKMVSKGEVDSAAFLKLMGTYEGAALKSGETTQGAFNNMKAALARLGQAALEEVFPLFKEGFGKATEVLDWMTDKVKTHLPTVIGWFKSLAGTVKDFVMPIWDELKGGITAFTAAWQYNDGEVTSSGFPGMMERVGYWARQAFDYIQNTAIPAFQRFIQEFKNGQGAGGVLRGTFQTLWAALKTGWNIIKTNILPALMDMYNIFMKYILPVLKDLIKFIITKVWPDIQRVFINNILPAVRELAETWKYYFDRVIKPAMEALFKFIRDILWPFIKDFYENGIKPTFKLIGDVISGAWKKVIKPALKAFVDFVSGIPKTFTTAVDKVKGAWNKLKSIVAKPIIAVIDFVNSGIIGSINKVLGWAGVDKIGTIPVPGSLRSAARGYEVSTVGNGVYALASGGILPGYSPGKDNFFFKGSQFDLALAGGEAVMRPEWTRAVGANAVNAMNAAARHGGVGGVRKMLGLASGGIFPGGAGGAGGQDKTDFNLLSFLKSPLKAIKAMFMSGINRIRQNPFYQFVTGAIGKVAGGVKDKVMSFFGFGSKDGKAPYGTPVGAPIRWNYGWRLMPKWGFPDFHTGVDFAIPTGTPVKSVGAGIAGIGYDTMGGNYVSVSHPNGMQTGYLHLSRAAVNAGQAVRAGQVIGYSGNTGTATTGPHLHFQAGRGTFWNHVNPLPFLYDRGGAIQPGLSLVANQTGKPEQVLTNEQWQDIREGNGGNTIVINGVKTDHASEVADELLFALKRTRKGKYQRMR